jgi:hypothetical protein
MLSLPSFTVDEFPDDVGMPGVPVGIGDHAHHGMVQRHLVSLTRPPRHPADRVQLQRVDRRVRVRPRPAVELHDVIA